MPLPLTQVISPGKVEEIFVLQEYLTFKAKASEGQAWTMKSKYKFGDVQVWPKCRGRTNGKVH